MNPELYDEVMDTKAEEVSDESRNQSDEAREGFAGRVSGILAGKTGDISGMPALAPSLR